jgi:hypothetical protein
MIISDGIHEKESVDNKTARWFALFRKRLRKNACVTLTNLEFSGSVFTVALATHQVLRSNEGRGGTLHAAVCRDVARCR